jgi:hypothetical protein
MIIRLSARGTAHMPFDDREKDFVFHTAGMNATVRDSLRFSCHQSSTGSISLIQPLMNAVLKQKIGKNFSVTFFRFVTEPNFL